ncbi:MAG: alpha/beta hydrolase, partial [Novosphingobium sp.]
NAKPGTARPAILHTHGGGFFMGSAEASIAEFQRLARDLDCVAVTVQYRLAPETIWAGSLEDNYTALKWLNTNAATLGVDPARIAVMGESAGGGHAALLAITARDRGEVPLCFQCLTYPMLDDRTGSSRPVPPHVGRIIWTAVDNRFGWESFLGQKPGGRHAPKGAVPARVENLAGLPPAWIGVGSIDLFFDEDVEYARRLNNAGVPAELIVVPGAFHGFDGIGAMLGTIVPIAERFHAARLVALRAGLGLAQA